MNKGTGKVILVINAGSSSIKFGAFAVTDGTDATDATDATNATNATDDLEPVLRGEIADRRSDVVFRVVDRGGCSLHDSAVPSSGEGFDHRVSLARLFDWLAEPRRGLRIGAVGHRVVHGADRYTAPVVVTDAVLADLAELIPLAPLHQPHNLSPIEDARARWPDVMQVACFDTAFHATQSAVVRAFALPREITDLGVHRYGFHGLSYEYVATQLPRVLGDRHDGKVVVAHLGSGASLCALVGGRSIATTMGFSALDGLMMGTRCGTLDAGVVLYLMQHHRLDVAQVTDLLYHRSGLLGVSGISSDMATLLESADARAAAAIDLFVHRIVVEIGALAATMGGLDALIFTAGIGEHAALVRSRVCAGCAWLGAAIDEEANAAGRTLIDVPTSALRLAIVPTDEEKMIALHTRALLAADDDADRSHSATGPPSPH